MSEQIADSMDAPSTSAKVVNSFSITIGTVNGSGSQTSNLTLLRALFKMGIPVSGKNIFPSNIQGLPTWYTIRVSKEGYLARSATSEIVVAMNPTTFAQDQGSLVPGGVFFFADHINLAITRDDLHLYPMPVRELIRAADIPANLRDYIANMVYVGVLSEVIGIEMEAIQQALDFHFRGNAKPVGLNFDIVQAGAGWARDHLKKEDPFFVQPMDATKGSIMTDGNTAASLGAIYGGVQFAAWYPITPATSLAEALMTHLPSLRKDPVTGENTYAVVQAEDELAAIGMTVGAGWGGLRAMTSTSGPGISLMAEFSSLAYFAEVPIVIWDVQRLGPSTGLPTRTAQGDINSCYYLGHGDTKHVVLLPGSVQECFEFGWRAFDLAESLQTPVFVLSDLDFGMNQWMTPRFEYPETPMQRGKVLWEEDMEEMVKVWGRYRDLDGDGIPYRTLPGNQHPQSAYFTRGTGHDDFGYYSEDPEVWEANMQRLSKKFETARRMVPKPVVQSMEGAEIGVIAFGSTDPAVCEARDMLKGEGIATDYLRLRALPIQTEVVDFIHDHKRVYLIEMNRDGQAYQILSLEVTDPPGTFVSLTKNDGLPLTAAWIYDQIRGYERV